MSAIWDGDTGHVTLTAINSEGAVNLAAATRTIIARNVKSGVATTLDEVPGSPSFNPAGGVIVANAEPLTPGTYRLALRCVDGTDTATYPSADQDDKTLIVKPKLDTPTP